MSIKSLIALTALSFALSVNAQEKKTIEIICNQTDKIINILTEQYGEQPIIFGKRNENSNVMMSMWLNSETQSWSLIVTDPEKSCVIITGDGVIIQSPKKSGKPV